MIENQEFISHPLIKDKFIKRRAYQEKIFINCLNQNSLVVIPTGLGKTVIALMLAVHRLSKYPDSKIIFLAPTKPLVNQHYNSFLSSTQISEEELGSITGTTSPEKRKEILKVLSIAFMTPQVLQNDIISRSFSLKNVSLIIFDECHRAVGDYAYGFIAQKYMENAKNPQILGLTASPGSTEAKINEIKENLFISHFEIRTEKDADVVPYVQNVDNKWIKIKLPEEYLEIIKLLNDKLKACYKFLKEMDLLDSYDINKVTRKDLLKLNKVINRKISSARDDGERFQFFYAKKISANSIRLSHMSELIETQGINALKDYLKKNEEKIKKNTANKSLKELFADRNFKTIINLTYKLQKKGLFHPKLKKLKDILYDQLKENIESRVLVFCHFRDSVNNIIRFFKEDEVIRAHKFVGQSNKGSDKGLTQKKQISLLKDFKAGVYNTLIGTSVAEEGLDIEECDLVVFYDVVPSAIRSIQRRGRTGRNKEGKVYVLIAEGTRDEGYYWAEKAKERKMRDNLKKIKNTETGNKSEQVNLLDFIPSKNPVSINDYEIQLRKINGAESYTIICDHRETASPVVRLLSLMGAHLKLEHLSVADYMVSERAGIERKTAQDFNDSIRDGRLFNELFSLKENFERAILILEGDPFAETNINPNALYGAITSIILNLGITIYRTTNAQDTAIFLFQLAKKEQAESKGQLKLRFKKAPIEDSRLLEFIISGIPGVNALRAKNLLSELKTLKNIFMADIPDLTKVDNIGKKIAQQIYKIARIKYKDRT
ncbi:MAG: DEAD/DEAH box helicase [Promethearchaeota archaeon]